MKKLIISILFFSSLFSVSSYAQCGEVLLKQALKEIGNGQYIKDYNIDLKKESKDANTGYVKYSVILQSRSQYRFNVVNSASNTESVIMQLYDGDVLKGSNFENGKMWKSFDIVVGKTKVYNLIFSFKGGVEGCASAVQSLVKQFTEEEMKM
jgi:hypothetical protein